MKIFLALMVMGLLSAAKVAEARTDVTEADRQMTIHSMGVFPVIDNVNSLYSRPVEEKLKSLIKDLPRFNLKEIKSADPKTHSADNSNFDEIMRSISRKEGVDALISTEVSKTQTGVEIGLNLYLAGDGNLFLRETLKREKLFKISDVEKQVEEVFQKLIGIIPYRGLVLSRQGNRVTVDLGARDNVKSDDLLTAEHFVSVKRHPKLKFYVSADREILGKIKLVKVEDTLSFGIVVQEKERDAIAKDSKIAPLDYYKYPAEDPLAEAAKSGSKASLAGDPVVFGDSPKEWTLEKKPSLGRMGLLLGLGSLHMSTTTQSAGAFSSDSALYPTLQLSGEFWITENWFTQGFLRQGLFSVGNPLGGNPSRLAGTNSFYNANLGYKFLLQDDFWGPTLNLHLGYQVVTTNVDGSTPLAFTPTSYSGFYFGFGGDVPINEERSYYVDANLDISLVPNMTEARVSSAASSSNSVIQFAFGGRHRLTTQFWINLHLNFDLFSTSFSGVGTRADPATSAAQNLFTVLSGVEYYF